MYNYRYTNPLTKQFQAEYALYEAVSKLFAGVTCRSLTPDRLRLYHAELSANARHVLDKQIRELTEKHVCGRVCFPAMDVCRAEVKIRNNADGSHRFTFTDGVYSFSVQLEIKPGGKMSLEVNGRRSGGHKPSEKSEQSTVNAQHCA